MEASRICPNGSSPFQYLPSDIIDEILLRLPVKSLLKFKVVCKSWLSFISSSKFIKNHLIFSRNSKNYANHRVIFSSSIRKESYTAFSCSLPSLVDENTLMENPKALYCPTPGPGAGYPRWIYGNCNGLLCIPVRSTLVLYNPATRKSKTLPPSGTNDSYFHFTTYGLCYRESDDDYIVVELHSLDHGRDFVTQVKIYSLRTNSWRKIDNDFHCSDFIRSTVLGQATTQNAYVSSCPGVNVGGVLYWPIRIAGTSLCQIFAVDTVTGTYTTFAAPKYENEDGFIRWGVTIFGGCLGVYYDFYQNGVDIWTMEESWTKVLTVPCCSNPLDNILPRIGLKDGEILLVTEPGYSMVYKPGENIFLKQVIPNLYITYLAPSPVYIESLVPPSFDGESQLKSTRSV